MAFFITRAMLSSIWKPAWLELFRVQPWLLESFQIFLFRLYLCKWRNPAHQMDHPHIKRYHCTYQTLFVNLVVVYVESSLSKGFELNLMCIIWRLLFHVKWGWSKIESPKNHLKDLPLKVSLWYLVYIKYKISHRWRWKKALAT